MKVRLSPLRVCRLWDGNEEIYIIIYMKKHYSVMKEQAGGGKRVREVRKGESEGEGACFSFFYNRLAEL